MNSSNLKEKKTYKTGPLFGFKKLGLAILLTFLFGVFLYPLQQTYENMAAGPNIYKTAIWVAIILYGSFIYDVFKSIVFMENISFGKFNHHTWKIFGHTLALYACTFLCAFLWDGDALSKFASIVLFFLIFFFMGHAISNFGKALEAVEEPK
jgi:hypothetical protein